MNPTNLFVELGLSKRLVSFLYPPGKLDNFIRDYRRMMLNHVHPDHHGNEGLSGIVNGAFSQITKHPQDIESWIRSMDYSSEEEYFTIINDLTEEVIRLQKIEREYAALKRENETLNSKNEEVRGSARYYPR